MSTRSPIRGSTLLELLIALVVLSLVTLITFNALASGSRFLADASLRASDAEAVVRAQLFLRSAIARMQPAVLDFQREVRGDSGALSFSAPLDRLGTDDPLYHITIFKPPGSDELRLIRAPDNPINADPESSNAHVESIILDGLTQVRFRYWYRSDLGTLVETEIWKDRDGSPELVSMDVEFSDPTRRWPRLMVRPLIDRRASCRYDLISKDCRDIKNGNSLQNNR